jgi:hypothetical protein
MSASHKVATPSAGAATTSDSIPVIAPIPVTAPTPVTGPNPVTANVRLIP